MNSLRICFCLFLTIASAWSLPSGMDSQSVGHNSIQAKEDLLDGIYSDCINKGSVSCIKYKLFAYVDKALNKDEINLTEGVTVVRSAGSPGDGAPRSLSLDGSADQPKDMESLVVKRVLRYLNEHSIKVDIKGVDMVNAVSRTGKSISDMVSQLVGDNEEEDSSEENRGIKKKKKSKHVLLTLLTLLKIKLAAILPFAIGKIALIAGKALLLGTIALVLSLIGVLQKVLSKHHEKTVTYEVIPQHHHEVHGGHDSYGSAGGADISSGGYGGGSASGGGWGRSVDAQQMAYSAQAPQTSQ
uniref:ACYPI002725 protein n=1 Tax=Acyrthosiphon pisum TaxID=7029 RepID=C4WU74_ACYPI|nr:ACYPI002725 [Acyrthosiphon pisum]